MLTVTAQDFQGCFFPLNIQARNLSDFPCFKFKKKKIVQPQWVSSLHNHLMIELNSSPVRKTALGHLYTKGIYQQDDCKHMTCCCTLSLTVTQSSNKFKCWEQCAEGCTTVTQSKLLFKFLLFREPHLKPLEHLRKYTVFNFLLLLKYTGPNISVITLPLFRTNKAAHHKTWQLKRHWPNVL